MALHIGGHEGDSVFTPSFHRHIQDIQRALGDLAYDAVAGDGSDQAPKAELVEVREAISGSRVAERKESRGEQPGFLCCGIARRDAPVTRGSHAQDPDRHDASRATDGYIAHRCRDSSR